MVPDAEGCPVGIFTEHVIPLVDDRREHQVEVKYSARR